MGYDRGGAWVLAFILLICLFGRINSKSIDLKLHEKGVSTLFLVKLLVKRKETKVSMSCEYFTSDGD